ncbi:MAG: methionine adenosyltransferase domain-containing protein [Bacilli bacterium]|jgi:S-adenosylmethionine synthetase
MKSAECVTPKHPDKLCDQISDAILDACLEQDPMSRVAMETMGGHGIITITGELTTNAYVDIQKIARNIVGSQYGIQQNIVQQSPEIARGVDAEGAGDQGIMKGYACDDNEAMIPQELYLSRSLCKHLYQVFPYDGKTEIVLDDGGVIIAIVASFQNSQSDLLRENIDSWLAFNKFPIQSYAKILCNAAGEWKQGGFDADTGVTGRKLMVDNYGPEVAIGGGAFSGKDATKVDRSGAYIARKIAVDLLKQYNAKEVFVKIAYAIGVAEPVMATAQIKTLLSDTLIDLTKAEEPRVYDLTPSGIIKLLDLRKPQFEETAKWGHFGEGFTWDK